MEKEENITVNQRVILLKNSMHMSDIEFCRKADISTGTLHRIKKGEKVNEKMIIFLASAFDANPDWLLTGEGEMFYLGRKRMLPSDLWQDATYKSLQDQIAQLKAMVNYLSEGKLFLTAPNGTGSHESESLGEAA